MNKVGLKMVLRDGQFLLAVLDSGTANQIIVHWLDGTYKKQGAEVIGRCAPGEEGWAVRLADVQMMHLVDLQALAPQQHQGPLQPIGPRQPFLPPFSRS